eukprot:7699660-Prorocentrum_lima.AAC.1
MTSSLVGSEMCIRDSFHTPHKTASISPIWTGCRASRVPVRCGRADRCACLLYTSDAADDM